MYQLLKIVAALVFILGCLAELGWKFIAHGRRSRIGYADHHHLSGAAQRILARQGDMRESVQGAMA